MAAKQPTNMRLWDALGKTDPDQTKSFTRAGGFKGTAIKPMWAIKRMTDFFGPCGLGWGPDKPEFQVWPAADETMVYCTVGLWYINNGQRGQVFGQGGDKVVIKGKEGLRTSDEAFKAAYTDALSNAMKMIGVGADVHMGLFDDNKYVQAVADEFRDEAEAEIARQKAEPGGVPADLEWDYSPKIGLLICRIMDAVKTKKKSGDGELITLKLNRSVIDGGKPMAFYFHKTHQDELLAGVGKIAKFIVDASGKFVSVNEVLEIDGVRMEKPSEAGGDKLKAELLASELGMTAEALADTYKNYCSRNWAYVVTVLEQEKAKKEVSE